MTPADYKKQIAARYTSLTIDELHKLPKHRLLVQEKHNGVFHVVERGGHQIAGELVGDQFHAFDLIGSTASYLDRLTAIYHNLEHPELIVHTVTADSHEQIREFFNVVVDNGGEGVIVRDTQSTRIWKIKPTLTVDCAVVGYSIGKDGKPRSLLLALDRNGFYVVVGSVPCRSDDLSAIPPVPAPTPMYLPSSDGTLYRFCLPDIAVEVSCNDLRSGGVRHPELQWTHGGWHHLGSTTSVSLVNPVLVRVRHDKLAHGHDVRWAQIADRVPEDAPAPAPPVGQVVFSNVWRKGDAVRKYVIFAYDKHPDFPPYVACWTDYAPGRAKPLERTVLPMPGIASVLKWIEGMVASEIKKGWE